MDFRRNNPGNIRGNYFGAVGSSGGFAEYPDTASGFQAMSTQLDRYYNGKTTGKPIQTINDIVKTWAPGNENNTPAYVRFVSEKLGVAPGEHIDLTDPATKADLIAAMAQYEHGKNPYSAADIMKFMDQGTAGSYAPRVTSDGTIAVPSVPRPQAAQAPQEPPPALAAAMGAGMPQAPQAPPQAPQESGIMGAITDPTGSEALLRFGAGMLSGKTLGEGMAQGAAQLAGLSAQNRQTQAAKNQQAQATALKLMDLGVPPAVAMQVATGKLGYDAISSAVGKKQYGDWKFNKESGKYERTNPHTGALETQSGPAAETDQFDLSSSFSKLDDALAIVKQEGTVGPIAGSEVGRMWDKYTPFGDQKREDARRRLDDIINNDILQAAEKLKPLSDSDMKFLKEGRPKTSDSPDRWETWVAEAKQRLQAAAKAKGLNLSAPTAPSSAPAGTSGGVSWKIVN